MSEEPRPLSSILGPPAAVVARVVGIVCIASGFVVGIEGLERPESGWLRTALALIVTGLAAQVFALYARVRDRRAEGRRGSTENGPARRDRRDDEGGQPGPD